MWGFYTRAKALVSSNPRETTRYVWGDQVIEFVHCNSCGCVTHYEGLDKAKNERIAVNFNMFPSDVYAGIPIRTFDGAETWDYID